MSSNYDVLVIGGGHNGLVAATYLGRAGKKVLVLEASSRAGGMAATDEFADGYRASSVFNTADRLHPSIVGELGLEGHGLKLVRGQAGNLLMRADGPPLQLGAGAPSGLPQEDVEALAQFEAFFGRISAALEPAFAEALPEIERKRVTDLLDLLALGWRLRRLGRKEMPLAMRMLPMALRDIADEHVKDERLAAGLGSRATVASVYGPFQPGLGLPLLYHRPAWTDALFRQPTFVVGGMGSLADSLVSAAKKAGVEIRTDARVERVRVSDDGVTGAVLESGDEVQASRVLSTVDPHTMMLRLLEPGWIEPDMLYAARTLRAHGTVSIVRMALDGLPAFREVDASALSGTIEIAPSMTYQEQAADCVKYGRVPEHPTLEVTLPSLTDPSLAPAGKHVLHAWVQYTPYRLRESDWDSERDRLGKIVVDTLEQYAPDLSRLVTAIDVATPLDIERRYGAREGHVYHAEQALDQSLYMRPFAGRYDYRMPVDGLYLGGSGSHPGGGITGLPGKLAARQVLRDWKARRVT